MAVEAAVFLALARFLVVFVPLRRWRRRIVTERQESALVPPSARKVALVVRKVADVVPFTAVCLQQAMAAQWMLRRRRVASQLTIGVRREPNAPPKAAERNPVLDYSYHAWLQVGGHCVVGCKEIESYSVLPPFESAVQRAAS